MIGGLKKLVGGAVKKLAGGLLNKLKGLKDKLKGVLGQAMGGAGGGNPLDFLKMLNPMGMIQGLGNSAQMRGL